MLKSASLTKFYKPLNAREYSSYNSVVFSQMELESMKRKHWETLKIAKIEAESQKRLRTAMGATEDSLLVNSLLGSSSGNSSSNCSSSAITDSNIFLTVEI
jgi:hypothetical protein